MNVTVNEQKVRSMAATPKPHAVVVCPRCSNDQCDRIPRSNFVKFIFPDAMKHYRCTKCTKRFYKWS